MGKKTIILTFLLFLILQHNFGSVVGSRLLNLHSLPAPAIPRALLKSPQPPALWYTINDEKGGEGDAFRPTTPGHSPGVGHQTPPMRSP